jgi:hypothetical protein
MSLMSFVRLNGYKCYSDCFLASDMLVPLSIIGYNMSEAESLTRYKLQAVRVLRIQTEPLLGNSGTKPMILMSPLPVPVR